VAELSKVTCKHCAKTYCIEHRFDCKHPAASRRAAAVATQPCAADVKRQLALDAALARAIAASQN
jgi:hypothetical protein